VQAKGNGHVDEPLRGGDKRGHDNPRDRISEDKVGDKLVLPHPKRGSASHDKALAVSWLP
jgi:hypothetical protein